MPLNCIYRLPFPLMTTCPLDMRTTEPVKLRKETARPPLTLRPGLGFTFAIHFLSAAEVRFSTLRRRALLLRLEGLRFRPRLRHPFFAARDLSAFVMRAIYLSIPSARITYEPPENSNCSSRTR